MSSRTSCRLQGSASEQTIGAFPVTRGADQSAIEATFGPGVEVDSFAIVLPPWKNQQGSVLLGEKDTGFRPSQIQGGGVVQEKSHRSPLCAPFRLYALA